jgi:L-2,4-diaminobutyrate decarboxylase
MNNSLAAAFNADEFRSNGYKLVDILSDYLQKAVSGSPMQVLPDNDPDKLTENFLLTSGGGSNEPFDKFITRIIDNSIHIHHPHYIGHQVTSPLPLTALVQFCTTLLNNGAAIYEMGPVNMAMERNVIRKLGEMIGFSDGFDGIFTHGGTAGNLTAMLAARQAKTDYNIWEEGIQSDRKPGYMMSEQSHYSVGRNVKIMGLGESSIVKVPYDSNYKMNTSLLEECRKRAEDKGIQVIAVAANSCSTATGSYDDLNRIADFCEKHDLWLHVDGAHGMGVLFSEKYRKLVDGIHRADSVVIDFHKMFLVPALNSAVIFRNGEKSYDTFAQKASYLFRKSQTNAWYNSATRTIECTKSALGIIAYTAIKYYGEEYYRNYIDTRYDLGKYFAGLVSFDSNLEIAVEPDCNIVCFRYIRKNISTESLNRINALIRERIVKSGLFYIVQTELEGKLYLRITIINPLTEEKHLKDLITEVKRIGDLLT